MKKDKLHYENIITDITQKQRLNMRMTVLLWTLLTFFMPFFTYTLCNLIQSLNPSQKIPFAIPILLTFLAFAVISAVIIFLVAQKSKKIRIGEIKITTDELIESTDTAFGINPSFSLVCGSNPCIFKFRTDGYIAIGPRESEYYRWSNEYAMNYKAIFNYAKIGDKFYIVTVNGEKNPQMIYNARMFEPEGLEIEKAYEDGASTAE